MDTLNPLPPTFTGDPELLARADALRPDLEALSNEIESTRRLPPALLDKLHQARLFRMLLPRSVDGLELDPITFMQVIETIARADGSTAWCLSQAGGCAMAAAYLDLPVAQEVFGRDPHAVLAWGPGPQAKVIAVDGGYRVSGSWAFASGGRHATWLGAHGPIFRGDGSPLMGEDGKQIERTLLVPAHEVVWTDIWDTVGLRGTASDMFALKDHFVRADHSITRDYDKECRETGPAYRVSALIYWAIGFASVGLGLARASLDAFLHLARHKVQRGLKSPLRDNAAVQTQLAQTEAALRAARAHLIEAVTSTWNHVRQPGALLTLEQRMLIRIASTYAIHQSREAVDFAYNTIGTSAVFANHPLERRFRDMHTVTQHLQARNGHFETVGSWMLGLEPDLTFV